MGSRLAIVLAGLLAFAGCGGSGGEPPLTAADILAKPMASSLKDAHFTVSGSYSSGLQLSGEGELTLKPTQAMHLSYSATGGRSPQNVELLVSGGYQYQKDARGNWVRTAPSTDLVAPEIWGGQARGARLVGQETLNGARAWHVSLPLASTPARTPATGQPGQLDIWIRQSDGYPLRYAKKDTQGSYVVVFDRFNTGASIPTPPADPVKAVGRTVSAKLGETVRLTTVDLTVVAVDPAYTSTETGVRPPEGARLIAVQVTYLNRGVNPLPVAPSDWSLRDPAGAAYPALAGTGKAPALVKGQLRPNQSATLWLTFQIPRKASGLVIWGRVGDDSVSVPAGV